MPIYSIALVWVGFTFLHPLYRVSDYVSVCLLSAVVFIVAKGIWPDIEYEIPDPEPEPEPEDKPEPEPEPKTDEPTEPQDPKVAALVEEKNRAIGEMRRLNDAIEDETISEQIDSLEETTTKIIDHVVEHPEKLSQIRKFMKNK